MNEKRVRARTRARGAIKNQEPTEGSGENARAEEEDEGATRNDALPHAL